MADVPGALDVGVRVDGGVEVRRGEAPALSPCGEGVLGVDARVQRLVHRLHALIQRVLVQQDAVYADVGAEAVAVRGHGEVDVSEVDRRADQTDEHNKRDKAPRGPSPVIRAACRSAPRARMVLICSSRGTASFLCSAVGIRSARLRGAAGLVGTPARPGGCAGVIAGCGAADGRIGPIGCGRGSASGTGTGVGFAFHLAFAPQLI